MEQKLRAMDGIAALDRDTLMAAKKMGVADSAMARFVGCKTADIRHHAARADWILLPLPHGRYLRRRV